MVVAQVKTHIAAALLGAAIATGACAVIVDKERAQQADITSTYEKALNDALKNQHT